MDLELTDEQTWLAESVATLVAQADAEEVWPRLADFGVLTIASGEGELGAVELALVGRELGRTLAVTPFVDSAAARYAAPGLCPADERVAVALLEPGGDWELTPNATTLSRPELVIAGRKCAVEQARGADRFLVLCDESILALVPREAGRLKTRQCPDPEVPLHDVVFDDAAVAGDAVLEGDAAESALRRLRAVGAVLAAAEAVGAAERLLGLACEYAAQRRQFGRPIGSFQALRHLLADAYVEQSVAWSSVLFAAAALDDEDPGALEAAAVAKAYASRATVDVAHGAIQVFGGIAFTEEHPAHRFLRRILVRARQYGDAAHHERTLGRALRGCPTLVAS